MQCYSAAISHPSRSAAYSIRVLSVTSSTSSSGCQLAQSDGLREATNLEGFERWNTILIGCTASRQVDTHFCLPVLSCHYLVCSKNLPGVFLPPKGCFPLSNLHPLPPSQQKQFDTMLLPFCWEPHPLHELLHAEGKIHPPAIPSRPVWLLPLVP